jgi:hypothetical protein
MKAFPSGEQVRIIILTLLLVGLAMSPLCLRSLEPSNFVSGISYQLTLETDTPLSNATFLIPLPVRNGIPAVGFLNLTESMFRKPGFNASFVSWEGNEYLRLTADTIDPKEYAEYEVSYGDQSERRTYDERGYQVEYQRPADYPYWINTREPIGNETVFLPKYNVIFQSPMEPTYSTGSGIRYYPVLSRYQTNIYAGYQTSADASVHIFASIEGQNSWAEEFDAWRGNLYSDYFQEYCNGPAPGWHPVNGELKSGEGKYLDGAY